MQAFLGPRIDVTLRQPGAGRRRQTRRRWPPARVQNAGSSACSRFFAFKKTIDETPLDFHGDSNRCSPSGEGSDPGISTILACGPPASSTNRRRMSGVTAPPPTTINEPPATRASDISGDSSTTACSGNFPLPNAESSPAIPSSRSQPVSRLRRKSFPPNMSDFCKDCRQDQLGTAVIGILRRDQELSKSLFLLPSMSLRNERVES